MKFEFEKGLRILNELIGYCHKNGGKDINANYSCKPGVTHLSVTAEVSEEHRADYEKLSRDLNRSREHELEECYWMGNGEDTPGDGMNLVSIMVDKADVSFKDNILTITVERFEHH